MVGVSTSRSYLTLCSMYGRILLSGLWIKGVTAIQGCLFGTLGTKVLIVLKVAVHCYLEEKHCMHTLPVFAYHMSRLDISVIFNNFYFNSNYHYPLLA